MAIPWLHVAIVLGAVLLLLGLHSAIAARLRSRRAIRRARRAKRGEQRAEVLLRRRGYRIDERQHSTYWCIEIDGESHEVLLRADLLVSKRGRRYVAEVKTGSLAPRIENVSTRRQLLEYLIAYQVDGVLLVAPESGSVYEVEFPTADLC